jgi:hypothetical protein
LFWLYELCQPIAKYKNVLLAEISTAAKITVRRKKIIHGGFGLFKKIFHSPFPVREHTSFGDCKRFFFEAFLHRLLLVFDLITIFKNLIKLYL